MTEVRDYADTNEIKSNLKKTKLILFNQCKKYDFEPKFQLGTETLQYVEEINLLGITLRSDLSWSSHILNITTKAYKRLWILRRLRNLGASTSDLIEVFTKQIRPVLEFSVPVWHSNTNKKCSNSIERVQKSALKIILQEKYSASYESALKLVNLQCLLERRKMICCCRLVVLCFVSMFRQDA